jgi:hypothetical protein
MLKKRQFFWWGIPLCLLLVAAWGYHLYNNPHRSAGSENATIIIDADSLYAAYQNDEHRADSQYLGKVIEVKGHIAEIQVNGQSEVWILSAQPGKAGQTGAGGINCHLFAPEKGTSRQYRNGDLVSIKGRCTGFLMDVNLADCVISQ